MDYKTLSYEEAKTLYPDAVTSIRAEAAKKLKRSKAKNKGSSVDELEWKLAYCVKILGSGSFLEAMSYKKPVFDSVEEEADEYISRVGMQLEGKMPGAYVSRVVTPPPDFRAHRMAEIAREKMQKTAWELNPKNNDMRKFVDRLMVIANPFTK